MNTLILSQADVRSLLTMDKAVEAVERAFVAYANGKAQMPHKIYLSLPEYDGDFRAMPAYFDGSAGVKWVNSHPQNPARSGLPAVMGMYILSDPATALPLAVMDATLLTAARTGAAAAVASKHLAPRSPKAVGFVGCGVQARFLLDAHRVVFGNSFEVLASDKDPASAEAFAAHAGGKVVSVEQASGADIVCVATPSRTPVIQRAWVRDGAHINAMGADAPGKQELDPAILKHGRVIIDDHEQATASGEINVPLSQGTFTEDSIHGTLGEIIVGKIPGREDAPFTVFDSTGLALQDVALARVIYDEAKTKGVGQGVQFIAD